MRARNRTIGVILGLAVAVGFVALGPGRFGKARHALLAENTGPIKAVALHYTLESSAYTNPCYEAFLGAIGSDVDIIAVCGSTADARAFADAARKWSIPNPGRIHTQVIGKPITGWCKDRFLVADGSPAALVCPIPVDMGLATRAHDAEVAGFLEKTYPGRFARAQLPIKFDAGDILATGVHIIVSDSLWRKNDKPADFLRRLEQAFSQKVIWLRDAPDHHIGMYAAPLQGKLIAVGDPELGRRLWSKHADNALGRADFSESATQPFTKAADQLKHAGFQLVKLPTAVLGVKTYISYTNGVFETNGGRRIVYMPWYDEPALDNTARRAYESAGWRVVPIPVRTVYKFRGTIGCLINVVERG